MAKSIKDEKLYRDLRDDGMSKEKAARISNAQANDSQNPAQKGGKAPPYEEWTKDDLYARAQEIGIEFGSVCCVLPWSRVVPLRSAPTWGRQKHSKTF